MKRLPHDGIEIPIDPVTPLLEAGEALFGTADPSLPGSHVVCATKDITIGESKTVWSAIALSTAEQTTVTPACSSRTSATTTPVGPGEGENALHARMEQIVHSIMLCGEDQDVHYKEIFTGVRV